MPQLTIDGRAVTVPQGTNVLEAAARLGIIIPRFCYHPALGSLGACRVCAVMFLEGPVKGVEMSCMTEAADGMVVSTDHPEAVDFRRYVIEWLMLHHPLDCPVCDEGGHCLLQDETISGGHGLRRYLGPKRTYRDQYLGVFVQHEMNRCIHCFRCRRFYQDFAGYRDLGAMQIGNRMYFGRFADGALESPFSGNLIDVCPTGVYTDKPSRFKGRRWHYERGPTLCLHCSLGCNLTGSAYNREMLRLEARLSETVNGYFACDRGRYGFAYVNDPERPRRARIQGREVPWPEGLEAAAARLRQVLKDCGPGAVACLGGSRSSLAAQGWLLRFTRSLGLRQPAFFVDPDQEARVMTAAARLDSRLAVSLKEIEGADFVLVVGADPVNEAPMLALALRQAARRGAPVAVLDPRPVSLPLDFTHLPLNPGGLDPALAVLLNGALGAEAAGLTERARQFFQALPEAFPGDEGLARSLADLAGQLARSRRPVIVCGTDIVPASTPGLAADAALLLKDRGREAGLFYLLPGPNAFGAALMSRPWAAGPAGAPGSLSFPEVLAGAERGEIKALVLVEADPFWSFPDEARLSRALARLDLLLVLDYLPSPAAQQAHVLLPTLAVFERTGSGFVNQEGRLQWAAPVHFGGTPMAQISPELHPPRTVLNYVPGGEPQTAGDTLAALLQTLDPALAPAHLDLWDWLAQNQNPLLARGAAGDAAPQGLRLLPEASPEQDFTSEVPPPAPAAVPPAGLELLLTDLTFGTDELAAYSPYIQAVEEAPRLTLHPADASRLHLTPGGRLSLALPGGSLEVELAVAGNMAPGVAVLPRHRRLAWRQLATGPLRLPDGALTRMEDIP
jgi:NADH-quinone oxidoreductase subunit G